MAVERSRVGSVVIDGRDVPAMTRFWSSALGYVRRDAAAEEDDFVVLRSREGRSPNLSLDGREPERGRIHVDLYSSEHDADVERLVRLGAKRHRPREAGEDFTVLEDPEGNSFCVVDARR